MSARQTVPLCCRVLDYSLWAIRGRRAFELTPAVMQAVQCALAYQTIAPREWTTTIPLPMYRITDTRDHFTWAEASTRGTWNYSDGADVGVKQLVAVVHDLALAPVAESAAVCVTRFGVYVLETARAHVDAWWEIGTLFTTLVPRSLHPRTSPPPPTLHPTIT